MRGPLFSLEPEAVDATANSLAKRAMKLQAPKRERTGMDTRKNGLIRC